MLDYNRLLCFFVVLIKNSDQMDYYCEVCYKYINHKSKYMHFKSSSHKEFDKCEHILLSLKEFDIKNVDEAF